MRLFYLALKNLNDESIVDAVHLTNMLEKMRLDNGITNHAHQLFRFISENILTVLRSKQHDENGGENEICGSGKPEIHVVKDGEFVAHCMFASGGDIFVVAITDKEYPECVAARLLLSVSSNDDEQTLLKKLKDLQDPTADKVYKIRKQLDETIPVLHETMEKLLERGDKLDDLVDRSTQLSQETKTFFRKTRKMNNRWWLWCFPWLEWLYE